MKIADLFEKVRSQVVDGKANGKGEELPAGAPRRPEMPGTTEM